MKFLLLLGFIFPLAVSATSSGDSWAKWLKHQEAVSCERILGNVLPQGAVIASTSRTKPDYYFHWVRDAALTVEAVMSMAFQNQRWKLFEQVDRFAEFTAWNQAAGTLTGLGEPKFYPDGRVFNESWGRPQNDGPALRASALLRLSKIQGKALYRDTIARDLDYVITNWEKPSFDIWEEVNGQHFYTLAVQRRALLDGSRSFLAWGDATRASTYAAQVPAIEAALKEFWVPEKNQITATLHRVGGQDNKSSGLDTAVLLAVLHSESREMLPSDVELDFLRVESSRVLATVAKLVKAFKSLYPINQNEKKLGVAIGRYPEDFYYGGNPWILTTAAMAEHSYRLATVLKRKGHVPLDAINQEYYELVLGRGVTLDEPLDADLVAKALVAYGDRFLARIQTHSLPDGGLHEQIHRKTGYMTAAENLTWSYAGFLTALWRRIVE